MHPWEALISAALHSPASLCPCPPGPVPVPVLPACPLSLPALSMLSAVWARAFKKRTPTLTKAAEQGQGLLYSTFDLLCVGVAATVGGGIFVVTGEVAHGTAGPGIVFSWVVAGLVCCLSAMAYAELTVRWPSGGSAYTYVYATLGEFPAVLTAWALTLECGVSSAAVSRSWGAKLQSLLSHGDADDANESGIAFNLYACLLQIGVVLLFLRGSDVSKQTVNVLTVLKTVLIVAVVVLGLRHFSLENVYPDVLPMGMQGVVRGATTCYFGFIGYDEVSSSYISYCRYLNTLYNHVSILLNLFRSVVLLMKLRIPKSNCPSPFSERS
jgi:basic amino acid/polyamine antiporter, APA family